MLLSDDSDFLVSFEGCVLLGRSFCFQPDGLMAKALSVQDRLLAIGKGSMDELRIMACQRGTDLTPQVEAEHDSVAWREFVQRHLDEQNADLFCRQYDLDAYVHVASNPGTECWTYAGQVACGLTSVHPLGPLDPLMQEFIREASGGPAVDPSEAVNSNSSQRLFQAYCSGHLSGQMMHLIRSQRSYTSCKAADFVSVLGGRDLRPVLELSGAWISRVAGFLLGEGEAESWEADERDLRFRQILLQKISSKALKQGWDAMKPVAEFQLEVEKKMTRVNRDIANVVQREKQIKMLQDEAFNRRIAERETLRQQFQGTDVEETVMLEAKEPPAWFWAGDGNPKLLHTRRIFWLVTGREELPAMARGMSLRDSLGETDAIKLFMLALTTVCDGHVAREHLRELCQGLCASQLPHLWEELRPLTSAGPDAGLRSLLVLGGLSWHVLCCLQDAYCLLLS